MKQIHFLLKQDMHILKSTHMMYSKPEHILMVSHAMPFDPKSMCIIRVSIVNLRFALKFDTHKN